MVTRNQKLARIRSTMMYPCLKKKKCRNCNGDGFFIGGAISTRTCKRCGGSGEEWGTDYGKSARKILDALEASE